MSQNSSLPSPDSQLPTPSSGKFIVLDGTDGSGKGTQFEILVRRLEQEGYPVKTVDFPQYGNYSAGFVERYLRGEYGGVNEVSPYTASLFYAVDRFDQKQNLHQWLRDGKIIVANRYISASKIHQAGKIADEAELEKYLQWLDHLEFEVTGIPRPDMVLFLNVPPHISQQLVDRKKQRSYLKEGEKRDIHEADDSHIQQSYDRACSLVRRYDYWEEIVCTEKNGILTKSEISEKIWSALQAQNITS